MAELESRIEEWAARQLADYDARTPGTLFGEGAVLSVSEAYRVQSAVVELRLERGEALAGYKVGCTSPKIRAQLGIDHSITGRLFENERYNSGAVLRRSDYAGLAIEGELAVELSREPRVSDFEGPGIPDCVGRVFPVIELHNRVLRGATPTAGELIANNAIHAGFVTGNGIPPADVSDKPSLEIFCDEQPLDDCAGEALLRTIHSSLEWLTEVVQERGDRLQPGQIVLTGSITGLFSVSEDCVVRVDAPPFGKVEASFV